MRKKLLAVVAATMIIGGIGYNSYASIDTQGEYKIIGDWYTGKEICKGYGNDCMTPN